ncbi:MAG: peroxiredoxin [Acidobacteriota bacterium]
MLTTGEEFPSFELQAHDGSVVSSSDLEGSIYLVYFYPKADTPGCTKEACAFRDAWSELKEAEIRVFGISYDTPRSNRAFAEKFSLPFLLLSDTDKALAKSVGADRLLIPVPKRISYLVGADGKILKTYPSVSPSSHAEDVLKDFSQFR